MVIRNYLYFDRKKVERYLSSLEEGIIRQKQEFKEVKKPKVEGKINAKIASLSIGKGYETHSFKEIRELPDTSLFERLEELLKKSKTSVISLPVETNIETTVFLGNIKRGDLIHITGLVELSVFDRLMNYIKTIMPTMKGRVDSFENSSQLITTMLSDFISINIIVNNPKDVSFIARVNKSILECQIEELNDEYEIFGRVKRVLNRSEKIQLYNMKGGIALPETIVTQFLGVFRKNPAASMMLGIPAPLTLGKLEIKYPAIEIEPVVIYW